MNGFAERRFRRLAGIAMLAAAPVAVLAEVLHPRFHPTDPAQQVAAVAAGPGRHYAAHALVLALLVLVVPAFAGLVHLLRAERGRLAAWALVAFVPGTVALAAVVGTEFVLWQMAQPGRERAEMVALMSAMGEAPGIVALVLAALLFPVAWVLLATGLFLTRTIPRWSAALLGIGLPLAFVVELGGAPKFATVGANVAYAFGLAAAGIVVLRRREAGWQPPGAGRRSSVPAAAG